MEEVEKKCLEEAEKKCLAKVTALKAIAAAGLVQLVELCAQRAALQEELAKAFSKVKEVERRYDECDLDGEQRL